MDVVVALGEDSVRRLLIRVMPAPIAGRGPARRTLEALERTPIEVTRGGSAGHAVQVDDGSGRADVDAPGPGAQAIVPARRPGEQRVVGHEATQAARARHRAVRGVARAGHRDVESEVTGVVPQYRASDHATRSRWKDQRIGVSGDRGRANLEVALVVERGLV